ncbi:alpha/beta hydrolase [Streptomyces chattanoogensis]|uniref:alpha/beta hydrolase n=1 Tax=Streptomyces chattanoogensis TaxID=66876 RepID=UPI0036A8C53D
MNDLRFAALESAKEEWAKTSSRLAGYGDRVDSHMRRPLHDWQGGAADTAQARMKRLNENFRFASQESALIQTTIDGAVTELQEIQKLLHAMLDKITRAGFKVTPDGKVVDADEGGAPGNDADPEAQKREEIRVIRQQEIFDAVRAAVEVDARYCLALSRLSVERGLKVDGLESQRDASLISKAAVRGIGLDGAKAPDKGTDPKKVHDWWNGLSEEERQEQLALNPSVIGNLDGIPSRTRDKANRVNLDRLIEMYPEPVPDGVKERHDGFKAIRERLISDAMHDPEPLLLGISPEGQGRAILSYGDPDTADNVAAYVPGLNTTLADVGDEDGDRAKHVGESAADGKHKTASMVWLGYDTPQTGSFTPHDYEVAGEARGKKGGADFGHFLDGIQATHQGERPHVTAIGHSYGSFTLGQAAQREGGIPADDIILVGSPGTGAQKAEELGVGADHVWAGAADSDLVTHAPSDAEKGFGIAGHLWDPHELHFGQDPASEEFGGRRFGVNPGWNPSSHSDYFESGSESLDNIGRIVSGRHGEVTIEERR